MLTRSFAGLFTALLLFVMLSAGGCASDGMMKDDSMHESMDKPMMHDSDGDMKGSMDEGMGDSM